MEKINHGVTKKNLRALRGFFIWVTAQRGMKEVLF
jgi:hypothetical protein